MNMANNLCVVFNRVSSDHQDLAMQKELAKRVLEKNQIKPETIVFIDENAVSAISKRLYEREHLQALLELVSQGKVKTLIVFARDRLARNAYDYEKIIILLMEHNVEVIFTSGCASFSDFATELNYGINCHAEGENIQRRNQAKFEQNPGRILGYSYDKKTKCYEVISEEAVNVLDLFHNVCDSANEEEVFRVLSQFKKRFHTDETKILRYLSQPFYAKSKYPIVPWETFQKAQSILAMYEINEKKVQLLKGFSGTKHPLCGTCKAPMSIRFGDSLIDTKTFYCCQGHKKIELPVPVYEKYFLEGIEGFLQKLDTSALEKSLDQSINRFNQEVNKQIRSIQHEVEDLCYKIERSYGRAVSTLFSRKEDLENHAIHLGEQMAKAKEYKAFVKSLIRDTIRQSTLGIFRLIAKQFVKSVYIISGDEIRIEFYFGDFTKQP